MPGPEPGPLAVGRDTVLTAGRSCPIRARRRGDYSHPTAAEPADYLAAPSVVEVVSAKIPTVEGVEMYL